MGDRGSVELFIRAALHVARMTQSDLARRTGMSLKHINNLTTGTAQFTVDSAIRVGRALDVAPVALLCLQTHDLVGRRTEETESGNVK